MADERPVKRAVKLSGAGGLAEKRDLRPAGTESPDAPLVGRTATLADPLTTSLLAEITRRETVEMSPAQLAEARRKAEAASDDADGDWRSFDDAAARDPAAKQ